MTHSEAPAQPVQPAPHAGERLPGVGIFGCGRWTPLLCARLRAAGFRVQALWDAQRAQAGRLAEQLGVPFHTDKVDALLLNRDVELIVILCQQSLHSQIVTKAFRIGKHVVCNWPSAAGLAELQQMCGAAAYYPSLISNVFFPLRFLRPVDLIRRLVVGRNFVGELTLVDVRLNGRDLGDFGLLAERLQPERQTVCGRCARPTLDSSNGSTGGKHGSAIDQNQVYSQRMCSGGLLSTVGPHLIDLIAYLTDLRAKRVNGLMRTFQDGRTGQCPQLDAIKRITVDDYCHFQMEMQAKRSFAGVHGRQPAAPATSQTSGSNKSTQPSKRDPPVNKENVPPAKQNGDSSGQRPPAGQSAPVAIVSLDSHLQAGGVRCELLLAGRDGYLRWTDGRLYGRQYERNNNQTPDEPEPAEQLLYGDADEASKEADTERQLLRQSCCQCEALPNKQNEHIKPECNDKSPPEAGTPPNKDLTTRPTPTKAASSEPESSSLDQSQSVTQPVDPQLAGLAWCRSYAIGMDQMIRELRAVFTAAARRELEATEQQLQRLRIDQPDGEAGQRTEDLARSRAGPLVATSSKEPLPPVGKAAGFEEAVYAQSVLDAIRRSSVGREWVQVQPHDPQLIPLLAKNHRRAH